MYCSGKEMSAAVKEFLSTWTGSVCKNSLRTPIFFVAYLQGENEEMFELLTLFTIECYLYSLWQSFPPFLTSSCKYYTELFSCNIKMGHTQTRCWLLCSGIKWLAKALLSVHLSLVSVVVSDNKIVNTTKGAGEAQFVCVLQLHLSVCLALVCLLFPMK